MGSGSREQFTKLLVLDFFASNVLLSPPNVIPFGKVWPERNMILDGLEDTAVFGTDIITFFTERLNRCERVLKELQNLADAIDLVVGSLLKDSTRETGDATGNLDPEKLFRLQELCRGRLNNVHRSMDRLNRSLTAQDRIRNIEESTSVKRLTILAAIFLPLSLSASILGMDQRFVDLKLKLYDFVGVSVIIGTAALPILLIVRTILKVERLASSHSLLSQVMAANHSVQSAAAYRRADFIWRALVWGFYCLMWALVLVSCTVGMVKSVILGLKILGFGCAGLLVYAIGGSMFLR